MWDLTKCGFLVCVGGGLCFRPKGLMCGGNVILLGVREFLS